MGTISRKALPCREGECLMDALIESIVKIGNHKRVIDLCEPHVMQPLQLESWMVRRTLVSWMLLDDEVQRSKQGDNKNNEGK